MAEICVLVKCLPKRENILERMQRNFQGNLDPDTDKYSALDKLWTTHRTVWASCFQKIIDNYCLLLKLLDECLKETLDPKNRPRIIGCKAQMKTFNFLFDLCFDQRHYNLTGNLSKTLQKENMSAVSWQRLTSLTAKTIQILRNDSDFDLFYETVCKKAERIDDLLELVLHRKRCQANYSIL